MSAQEGSTPTTQATADKGKGKAVEDVSMGENVDENDDSSSEEEVEDAPVEDVEEETSDNDIDPANIIPSGRRTRGKQIDFAKAAQELPANEEDDEDDESFNGGDDDEEMEGN